MVVCKLSKLLLWTTIRCERAFGFQVLRHQISDKHGATIVSTAQSFNTTNATDRMLPNILRTFARFERELTAERIAANLKVAQDIRAHVWCNRTRTTEAGRSPVGRLHDKSSAHQILHCRTYLDVLKHRDQYFEGTHAPIIDRPPWDEAYALLMHCRQRAPVSLT